MKKLLALALVLMMVLALTSTTMAAAPMGFIKGDVTQTDKKGYDNFDGKEITANNSVIKFDSFIFVADNKTLNAWYIDVADDISGALAVAYKVGSAYYVVTFDIDGPGKYWIADSKGSAGANMVKIGAFELGETPIYYTVTYDWGGGPDYPIHLRPVRVTVPAGMYTVYMENIAVNPVGWSTNKEATDAEYYNGDEILVDRDITLFAVFHQHVWDSGVITAPNCVEQGYTTYTCKCGDEYFDDYVAIDPDNHKPPPDGMGEKWNIWPATCLEDTYEAAMCMFCHTTKITTHPGTALGHDWDDGVVTIPANCVETGEITFTCKRVGCGATYTEEIDIDPDNHKPPPDGMGEKWNIWPATCLEDTYEAAMCMFCHITKITTHPGTALGHDYVYRVVKEPDLDDPFYLADGEWEICCTRCGDVKESGVIETYILGLYMTGSIWGEPAIGVVSGVPAVVTLYDPEYYCFIEVYREHYGYPEYYKWVNFYLNIENKTIICNDPCFTFEWDGGYELIVTFTREN